MPAPPDLAVEAGLGAPRRPLVGVQTDRRIGADQRQQQHRLPGVAIGRRLQRLPARPQRRQRRIVHRNHAEPRLRAAAPGDGVEHVAGRGDVVSMRRGLESSGRVLIGPGEQTEQPLPQREMDGNPIRAWACRRVDPRLERGLVLAQTRLEAAVTALGHRRVCHLQSCRPDIDRRRFPRTRRHGHRQARPRAARAPLRQRRVRAAPGCPMAPDAPGAHVERPCGAIRAAITAAGS